MLIAFTGLAIMGAAVENVNISYITPYAKCDLKLTIGQQGVLASVSFLVRKNSRNVGNFGNKKLF